MSEGVASGVAIRCDAGVDLAGWVTILFAQEQGVRRVYLNLEDLKTEFDVLESLRFGDIEILIRNPETGENAFLMMSRFFYGHYVPRAVERDQKRLVTILREAIRPILMPDLAEGALDAGTVVVHICSGDLFTADGLGGHAGYVQPPLAYYLACLAIRPYAEKR